MTDGGAGWAWAAPAPLILASRSTSRLRLLSCCGIEAVAIPADIDERRIEAKIARRGASPATVARALAAAKALAVSDERDGIVLGGDQVLDFEDRCLSKAASLTEAAERLARLAGKVHRLHSAAAVARDGVLLFECVDTAILDMRPLSASDISAYLAIAGEDVLGSVGAYRIEGLGRLLFDRVAGEQSTIVGLPLGGLLAYFRGAGLIRL